MKSIKIILLLTFAISFSECKTKKEAEIWFCPMHKHYQTDKPGECPICGMRLIKKESGMQLPKPEGVSNEGQSTTETPADNPAATVPQAFTITPEKQQMLRIELTKPQIRKLAMTLRLPAQVAYEPDLYTALIEYRQLAGQASSLPEGVSGGAILSSAKLRVRQLGLGDDEIRQFAYSQTALSRLLTGTAAGQALISLQVSEGEIGLIKKGLSLTVTSNAYNEKKFTGRITGIGTLVDAKRRVFTVRGLVTDAGQSLRAQMFVAAEVKLDAGKGLSVPRGAVFNTGMRQVVFVKKNETEFVPREVKILGGNDEFAIISGIEKDEDIVTSSAFLLDSEARVRIEDYK